VQKKNAPDPKGQQKFLSVSQPETPGESTLPQTTVEVDKIAEVFCSSGWPEENIICLRGPEATVDAVSSALDSCSWLHFACHGFQDPILGMKSAFALQDGHLTLGEIAKKRFTKGQFKFAFLSACHAASGLKDLPGEAMHLAAGLQFCGFPNVIATMWSIRDEDASKVADNTYRYLFRNGLQGLDSSEAAMALSNAILHLREDCNITVDQWAPFIHFGI
jgi:CHAT domain-containing protein